MGATRQSVARRQFVWKTGANRRHRSRCTIMNYTSRDWLLHCNWLLLPCRGEHLRLLSPPKHRKAPCSGRQLGFRNRSTKTRRDSCGEALNAPARLSLWMEWSGAVSELMNQIFECADLSLSRGAVVCARWVELCAHYYMYINSVNYNCGCRNMWLIV